MYFKKTLNTLIFIIFLCIVSDTRLAAQSIRDNANSANSASLSGGQSAPPALKRIVIFSSGLAYFEHSGTISGGVVFNLPFKTSVVNDALKSLVLNDPASTNPLVSYQSEQTLVRTLKSLSIDLSGSPDIADILAALRGEEIEITAPNPISGRIVGIERRVSSPLVSDEIFEPWLSLYTEQGLRQFNMKEISSIQFKESRLNNDLKRGLDLIAASRQRDSRDLLISLPGTGSRQVSLSYVLPSPVWKVSYRLDLGRTSQPDANSKPLFQGWAIVDNDSDTDWNNVSLSLVAGRPVSFIQNLYPPYYVSRQVVPLAIAGTAAAQTHDASERDYIALNYAGNVPAPAALYKMAAETDRSMADISTIREREESARSTASAPAVSGGAIQGAQGNAAGDQFEFTIKSPVSLERRMSAMLPLVEAPIAARKTLIFSGSNPASRNIHPRLGAEITNNTGMKLPAGPITVYEDGTYAGDALIEFWNEDEKRLVSYGEDLSVNGSIGITSTRTISTVSISGGVMTISRSQDYYKTYTFQNQSANSKSLLVEHPKTQGAELKLPEADEETPSAYRFILTLQPQRALILTVHESQPLSERITLLSLRPDTMLSYSVNQEIPARVRAALEKAIELKRAADTAQTAVSEQQNKRNNLISEQDRIRKNLEAAGGQTSQGQEYLKRMANLDKDIDQQGIELEKARSAAKAAQDSYENYLNGLKL